MRRSWTRVPPWRRPGALVANWFRMVVLYGLRSWWRDLRMVTVAIGSLALVLMLAGFLTVGGIALAHATAAEAEQASILRVYLSPGATSDEVAALTERLKADRRVIAIRQLTAEEALAEAKSRPGLGELAGLANSNPFSPSLDVQARRVTDLDLLSRSVQGDPAVDPGQATSYDPATFARLRQMALVIAAVGGGLALLVAFVLYAVAANSMRAIALARREEVALMRLLAARQWMLRGPFVVEGITTGAFAGACAAGIVAGAWLLAGRLANTSFSDVLPGVGLTVMENLVAGVLVAGLLLGALTSWLGFRRLGA